MPCGSYYQSIRFYFRIGESRYVECTWTVKRWNLLEALYRTWVRNIYAHSNSFKCLWCWYSINRSLKDGICSTTNVPYCCTVVTHGPYESRTSVAWLYLAPAAYIVFPMFDRNNSLIPTKCVAEFGRIDSSLKGPYCKVVSHDFVIYWEYPPNVGRLLIRLRSVELSRKKRVEVK